MEDDEDDWIKARTSDISAIVESRKNEVLSSAQSYLKLVQASDASDKLSRQQALLRPQEFIEELLVDMARAIAEHELEDDRTTCPDDEVTGKIREFIEQAIDALELRERLEKGNGGGHGLP